MEDMAVADEDVEGMEVAEADEEDRRATPTEGRLAHQRRGTHGQKSRRVLTETDGRRVASKDQRKRARLKRPEPR